MSLLWQSETGKKIEICETGMFQNVCLKKIPITLNGVAAMPFSVFEVPWIFTFVLIPILTEASWDWVKQKGRIDISLL